jgi:hypothetical protein
MEKQNDSMRERLLARLPQPENLAAYREETAALLAKHEKALFWEKLSSTVILAIAVAVVMADIFWGHKIGTAMNRVFWSAGFLFLVGFYEDLRYRVYRSQVNTLKEVKQIQLQILELQASFNKRDEMQ